MNFHFRTASMDRAWMAFPVVVQVASFFCYSIDFLAWAGCFPIVDHVIFPKQLFFLSSKNYSFTFTRLFNNLKARIPKSLEMGQQTAQVKKGLFGNELDYLIYEFRLEKMPSWEILLQNKLQYY